MNSEIPRFMRIIVTSNIGAKHQISEYSFGETKFRTLYERVKMEAAIRNISIKADLDNDDIWIR